MFKNRINHPADSYSKWIITIHAVIWLAVFLYPLLGIIESLAEGDPCDWHGVIQSYVAILPFFVIFLINTLLLLPRLLFIGKYRLYILSAAALLTGFILFKCFTMPPRHEPPPAAPAAFHPAPPHPAPFQAPHRFSPAPDHRPPGHGAGPIVTDSIIAFLLIAFGAGLRAIFNNIQSKKQISDLENLKMKYELSYLKAQLSPHFFMNILNNIHGMVELNPQKAQKLLLEMSKLMRYVLYESSSSRVTLSRELSFIESYISLMKSRYSSKKVEIHLRLPDPGAAAGLLIPPLIFIVFIENAFKHGISYRGESFIAITFRLEDDRLLFSCSNSIHPGADSSGRSRQQGGVGLTNVRKRLEMIYGSNFSLLTDHSDQTFNVTLDLPAHEDKMSGN